MSVYPNSLGLSTFPNYPGPAEDEVNPATQTRPTRASRRADQLLAAPGPDPTIANTIGRSTFMDAPDMSLVGGPTVVPNNKNLINGLRDLHNKARQNLGLDTRGSSPQSAQGGNPDTSAAAATQAYTRANNAEAAPPVRAVAPSGTASVTMPDGTVVSHTYNHANDAPRTDIDQVQKDRQTYAANERQLGDAEMQRAGAGANYNANRNIASDVAAATPGQLAAQTNLTNQEGNAIPQQMEFSKENFANLQRQNTELQRQIAAQQQGQNADEHKREFDLNQQDKTNKQTADAAAASTKSQQEQDDRAHQRILGMAQAGIGKTFQSADDAMTWADQKWNDYMSKKSNPAASPTTQPSAPPAIIRSGTLPDGRRVHQLADGSTRDEQGNVVQ